MTTVDTAMVTLHLLFAALWTGGVVYVAWAVLPLARDGTAPPGALRPMIERLRTLSRASALVLVLTGGHLAGARYTADSLLGSTAGTLVLAMVLLWLVLMGLVEVGTARLLSGFEADKLREPAHEATWVFRVAALVALLLLIDAGLLTGGL